MKEKGKAKSLIVIVILILVGVLAVFGLDTAKDMFSSAAGGAEPIGVKVEESANSAAITWSTEKEVMAVLQYGTTPASLLLRALETNSSVLHKVSISPLKSGTTYYFNIRVGDDIFDNGGIPYSFKTGAGEAKIGESVGGSVASPIPSPTEMVQATPVPVSTGTETSTEAEDEKCSFLNSHYGDTDSEYDYNGDGKVNVMDFVQCRNCQEILDNIGSTELEHDRNGDGKVNMPDYLQCLSPPVVE